MREMEQGPDFRDWDHSSTGKFLFHRAIKPKYNHFVQLLSTYIKIFKVISPMLMNHKVIVRLYMRLLISTRKLIITVFFIC